MRSTTPAAESRRRIPDSRSASSRSEPVKRADGFWLMMTGWLVNVLIVPIGVLVMVGAAQVQNGGEIIDAVALVVASIEPGLTTMLPMLSGAAGLALTAAAAISVLTEWGKRTLEISRSLLRRVDLIVGILLMTLAYGFGYGMLLPLTAPVYWPPYLLALLVAWAIVGVTQLSISGPRYSPAERLARAELSLANAKVRACEVLGVGWRQNESAGAGWRSRATLEVSLLILFIHLPAVYLVLQLPWPVVADGIAFVLALSLPAFVLTVARAAGLDRSTPRAWRTTPLLGFGAFAAVLLVSLLIVLVVASYWWIALTTMVTFGVTVALLFGPWPAWSSSRLRLLDVWATDRAIRRYEQTANDAEAEFLAAGGITARVTRLLAQRKRIGRADA